MELITVDNPVSKVFARWKDAIEPEVGKGNYSYSKSKTLVNSDKYARIFLMGNPTTNGDLAGDEISTTPSFQADSFASGEGAESVVYHIDDVSHKAMVNMGFRRTYGPTQIDNYVDSNIIRVTSRYTMLYTGYLLEK